MDFIQEMTPNKLFYIAVIASVGYMSIKHINELHQMQLPKRILLFMAALVSFMLTQILDARTSMQFMFGLWLTGVYLHNVNLILDHDG